MKRKILLSLVLMCFGILIFGVMNVSAATYDDYLTYEVSDDGTYITIVQGSPGTISDKLEIPVQINNIPVTSIGYAAFKDCSSLTEVAIPEGVTSIGDYAFSNCTGMTSVYLPESLTKIGRYAFNACTSLKKIYWNAVSVVDFSYNDNVFLRAGADGEGIEVVFGDTVEKIPAYAFYYYDETRNLFPKIISITIPESVTNIGESAFSGCKHLEKLNWNAGNYIGRGYVFSRVGTSGNGLEVILGDNVKQIPDYLFYNCRSLTSITISSNVIGIGEEVFYGCNNLTCITVDGDNSYYCSVDGNVFSKDKTIFVLYAPGKTESTFAIPNSVTTIDNYAFNGCNRLKSIIISESVKSIGSNAFLGCSFTSVYITDLEAWCKIKFEGIYSNLLQYAEKAYIDNVFIEDIVIPSSLTAISDYAFFGCNSLESIIIPDSVTNIGKYAFCNCKELKSVTIYGKDTSISNYVFYGCDSLSNVILEKDVKSLGDSVFYNCDSLTNITIPNSVTSIGSDAFYDCDGLVDIVIPGSVKNINSGMFYDCDSLLSVILEDGVTTIGQSVFYECDKLEKIIIPGSVTETMGFCAIYGCTWLTDVYYGGNSWYDIYDNKYNLHLDGCGRATIKYFRNVTILDSDGNTIDKIRKDLNAILDLSDINLEKGKCTKLYTDKELKKEYSLDTAITENVTLYAIVVYEYTTTAVSQDSKTFTVNATGVSNGDIIILALYNNGQFIEMQKATYEGDEITFTTDKSYTNAKVMAWEKLSSLSPVTNVEIVK